MDLSRNGKHALQLAEHGFHVFPVEPRGKKPLCRGGFRKATTNRETIIAWWTKWPHANIGAWPGPSGLCIIDVDGDEGLESARQYGIFDVETLTAITGRPGGGSHRYFKRPDFEVTNTSPFGPGVDVRCDGGYVVVPPSIHPSGARYEWRKAPVADLPPAALEALRNAHTRKPAHKPPEERSVAAGNHKTPVGSRNNTLIKLLGALRRQGATAEAMIEAAHTLNRTTFAEPLPDDEVDRVGRSAALWAANEGTFEELTDMGNARRIAKHAARDLRYVPGLGWMHWAGARWEQDVLGRATEFAKESIRLIPLEADAQPDEDQRKAIRKWARSSQSAGHLASALRLAQSEPELALRIENLDANPELIATANGTIDLRSGEVRPSDRADYITKMLSVSVDRDAKCPRWVAFLSMVLGQNVELIEFLQRALGYAITGSTKEQCLFLLHGDGANGKSTFLETLGALLHDYWTSMNFSTLTSPTRAGPSEDLARLRGARFVTAIETGENQRFNEALLKQLTGSDTIAARFLYQSTFTFRPSFKLFLAANHKPRIAGSDYAIWRRIKLIPFEITIPESDRDRDLPEKLKAELPGILNWILHGHDEWVRRGLDEPDVVAEATAEYHHEQDIIGAFLDEECFIEPLLVVPWRELFTRFRAWCDRAGCDPMTETMFGERLTNRGFRKERRPDKVYVRYGLALRPEDF